MSSILRKCGWEVICFFLFFGLVADQIFVPPVTGLANNSDFVYVLGKLSICPADREKQDNIYLVTDYFVDPVQCTWDIGLISSEIPLVMAARFLSAPFTGFQKFDLRALGALHLTILLLAFGILLSVSRKGSAPVRYGVPILFLLIFSDVAYTGYLNSVYLDAPSLVWLVATSAIAVAACLEHRSWGLSAGFLLCGTALVFAKSQHALLGLVFSGIALVLTLRRARFGVRLRWGAIAILLAASTLTMLAVTPTHYRLFALYNVIFTRLTPHSLEPWLVVNEVGLNDDDLKYLNTNAYTPGAPVGDAVWSEQFLRRTSFGKLAWFYLRNPDVVLKETNRELVSSAAVLRPKDMANYREEDGFPPRTLATRFSLWSSMRSRFSSMLPHFVIAIYLAPWLYAILAWKYRQLRSPLIPVAIALSLGGVMEFELSTLTDALDNSRHLFIFQVITELLILMIAGRILDAIMPRKSAPTETSDSAREVLIS
jgi:hypothetical protein